VGHLMGSILKNVLIHAKPNLGPISDLLIEMVVDYVKRGDESFL
jgi:hypothetical protein